MPNLKTFKLRTTNGEMTQCLVKTSNAEQAMLLVNHAVPTKVIFAIIEVDEVEDADDNAVYELQTR